MSDAASDADADSDADAAVAAPVGTAADAGGGGARIGFRPLERADFGSLSEWLARPHVERWWREDASAAAVEARYGPMVDGDDPTEGFIVEIDGRPIGFIQRYRVQDDPEWRAALAPSGTPGDAAGVDYLIGHPSLIGTGLGPVIIDRFVADLWLRYPDVPAVVANIDPDNRRSWRAIEKAGFTRAWSGFIESDDPSVVGPNLVYVRHRGSAGGPAGVLEP